MSVRKEIFARMREHNSQALLEFIYDNQPVMINDIKSFIDRTRRTANNRVNILIDLGIVRREVVIHDPRRRIYYALQRELPLT